MRSFKLNRTTRAFLVLLVSFTTLFSIFAFAYKRASGQDFAAGFRPSTLKSSHAPLNVTSAGNLTTGADTTTFISAGGVSGGFNNGTRRANATLLMLARNNELEKAMQSVRELEEKFNHQFGYPWVFLNNMPFSQEFKEKMSAIVSGPVTFALTPPHHWYQPGWIDEEKASASRDQMVADDIIYAGSVSYRNMCRFNSGFFYRHPVLQQYKWYWRVEPDVHFHCVVDEDPFVIMEEQKKVYGFTIALLEWEKTITTLWKTVKDFIEENPHHVAPNNSMGFLSDNDGETYNLCHFWSNFEIADMDFWRGEAYTEFFHYLDKHGGFYYERWGDAPVHSIAAALFLNKDQLHFFDEIGYEHAPFTHCPHGSGVSKKKQCSCRGWRSFDYQGYSCLRKWERIYK